MAPTPGKTRIRRTAAWLLPILVSGGAIAAVTVSADAGTAPSAVAVTEVAAGDRAKALSYWTADRMRRTGADSTARAEVVARPWTADPPKGVGRLFMVVRTGSLATPKDNWCTATAVPSPNRDVVVTAAHCVWPGYNRLDELGQVSNLVFVPGYSDGATPNGMFAARAYLMPKSYQEHSSPDVAMIVLDPAGGRHVADAAGTQDISFTETKPGDTSVFGYPGSKNAKGQRLLSCALPAQEDGDVERWKVNCDMAGGSSGGPWLKGFREATGTGTIYSVTAKGTAAVDDSTDEVYTKDLVGPKLDGVAKAVYEAAGGH